MRTPETYPRLPIPDQSNQKSLVMDPGLVLFEVLVYFYIYLLVSFKASQVIHTCSQPVNHIGDKQSWVTWDFLSFRKSHVLGIPSALGKLGCFVIPSPKE